MLLFIVYSILHGYYMSSFVICCIRFSLDRILKMYMEKSTFIEFNPIYYFNLSTCIHTKSVHIYLRNNVFFNKKKVVGVLTVFIYCIFSLLFAQMSILLVSIIHTHSNEKESFKIIWCIAIILLIIFI